jgi:hypothetical protein
MTIPFVNDRFVHRRQLRTQSHQTEPQVSELLDDPVLQMLMAVDGVERSYLEQLIRRTRRRLGPGKRPLSGIEAELFAECQA